jgi:hypothetical protein
MPTTIPTDAERFACRVTVWISRTDEHGSAGECLEIARAKLGDQPTVGQPSVEAFEGGETPGVHGGYRFTWELARAS